MHEYTVKEAIHDKAVLGFQIEYKRTMTEERMDEYIVALKGDKLDIDEMEMIEKEAELRKEVYLDEKHMLEVIDSIVNKSRQKLGFKKGSGQTYEAISTTSSILQAQRYYDLIKATKPGNTQVQISEDKKGFYRIFPK